MYKIPNKGAKINNETYNWGDVGQRARKKWCTLKDALLSEKRKTEKLKELEKYVFEIENAFTLL